MASTAKLILIENFLLSTTGHPVQAILVKGTAYVLLLGCFYGAAGLPKWSIVALWGLGAVYLVAQIEYTGFTGEPFLSVNLAGLVRESGAVLGHGFTLHSRAAWALVDLPVVAPLLLLRVRLLPTRTFVRGLLPALIGLIILAGIYVAKRNMSFRFYGGTHRVKTAGFLVFEAVGAWERHATKTDIRWGATREIGNRIDRTPGNVVLIQVETLDARLPWARAGSRSLMPRLQALAKRAMVYPYVLSFHGIGGSSDADFAMEFSAPPSTKNRSLLLENAEGAPIPKLLASTHRTIFVHGNDGSFFGRRASYRNAGFSEMYFSEQMNLPELSWGNPDGPVLERALALTRGSRPYFLHIVTMSTHEPFNLWKPYVATRAFPGSEQGDFDEAFHYTDSVLGTFLDSLLARGRTWVLVTGDHTPGNLVRSYPGSFVDQPQGRLEFVPLLVFSPDGEHGIDDSLVHSFLDILPTVIGAAGVACTARTDGEDLSRLYSPRGLRPIPLPAGGSVGKRDLRRLVDSNMAPTMSSFDSAVPGRRR